MSSRMGRGGRRRRRARPRDTRAPPPAAGAARGRPPAMVKSNSLPATKSSAALARSAGSGATATAAPTMPMVSAGFSALRASATRDVRRERRRARVHHAEVVLPSERTHVVEGEAVGGRVDQARAGHQRGGLGQPRRVPEGADLAPRLIARAGAAVEAVGGGRMEKQRAEIVGRHGIGPMIHGRGRRRARAFRGILGAGDRRSPSSSSARSGSSARLSSSGGAAVGLVALRPGSAASPTRRRRPPLARPRARGRAAPPRRAGGQPRPHRRQRERRARLVARSPCSPRPFVLASAAPHAGRRRRPRRRPPRRRARRTRGDRWLALLVARPRRRRRRGGDEPRRGPPRGSRLAPRGGRDPSGGDRPLGGRRRPPHRASCSPRATASRPRACCAGFSRLALGAVLALAVTGGDARARLCGRRGRAHRHLLRRDAPRQAHALRRAPRAGRAELPAVRRLPPGRSVLAAAASALRRGRGGARPDPALHRGLAGLGAARAWTWWPSGRRAREVLARFTPRWPQLHHAEPRPSWPSLRRRRSARAAHARGYRLVRIQPQRRRACSCSSSACSPRCTGWAGWPGRATGRWCSSRLSGIPSSSAPTPKRGRSARPRPSSGSLTDPEIVQHRVLALLPAALGLIEWLIQERRLTAPGLGARHSPAHGRRAAVCSSPTRIRSCG